MEEIHLPDSILFCDFDTKSDERSLIRSNQEEFTSEIGVRSI